jgi:hypothetical protein
LDRKEPDLSLAELCERLAKQGVSIKTGALWHQLNKWNLTFKKNPARQRARTRGRAAGARAWMEALPTMNVEKLVFIDETWTSTNMTGATGARPGASVASARHRTGIGKRQPLWALCAAVG